MLSFSAVEKLSLRNFLTTFLRIYKAGITYIHIYTYIYILILSKGSTGSITSIVKEKGTEFSVTIQVLVFFTTTCLLPFMKYELTSLHGEYEYVRLIYVHKRFRKKTVIFLCIFHRLNTHILSLQEIILTQK